MLLQAMFGCAWRTAPVAMQIRIADDGIGFDGRQVSSGLGLRSIRERVARLNGRLTIASEPAAGTVDRSRDSVSE